MLRNKEKNWDYAGFSLMEMLLVVVIIAILVALALPAYQGMKEEENNKDASANLKLIMAAQKVYRMEMAQYAVVDAGLGSSEAIDATTTGNVNNVNSYLKLSLPSGGTRSWNYRVKDTGGGSICAEANRTTVSRTGGSTRNVRFRSSGDDEPSVANCP